MHKFKSMYVSWEVMNLKVFLMKNWDLIVKLKIGKIFIPMNNSIYWITGRRIYLALISASVIHVSTSKDIIFRNIVFLYPLYQVQGAILKSPLELYTQCIIEVNWAVWKSTIYCQDHQECDMYHIHRICLPRIRIHLLPWDSILSIHEVNILIIRIHLLPRDRITK